MTLILAVVFVSVFLVTSADHECGQLSGTCMFNSYPCYGTWNTGLCLGPSDRQCCVHWPSHDKTLDPGCTNKGGVCQENEKPCSGHQEADISLCSGPPGRVCCIEEHNDPFAEYTRPPNAIVDGQIGLNVVETHPKGGDVLDIRWRDICGIPGEHMKTGLQAAVGSWPWMAFIWRDKAEEKFCTGSLVAPNYVLTSASCILSVGTDKLTVRMAENDINEKEGPETDYKVMKVYVHEKYGAYDHIRHNLALLKLENESVNLSRSDINTVCLPVPQQSFQGRTCWTFGWRPNKRDRTTGWLKQLRATALSSKMCARQIWGFTEGLMCSTNRQEVACMTNGGSPLVCEEDGRFFLAGVAAFSESACTEAEPPRVFTDVPFYLNWIYMKTRKSYEAV